MRSKPKQHREPPTQPPIRDVLLELGATVVPEGAGWVPMRCYAHPDRNPSASVNHERNAYVCHQCGIRGDSLKLLTDELGLSFTEALSRAEQPKRRSVKRRASDLLRREMGLE